MRYALSALFLAAAALPAAADELVLKNGARIEGRITDAGSVVTVEMDMGTVTFRRSEVAKIVLGPSALQEFDEKVRALKAGDVDGRRKLAVWARQRELTNRSRELLQEILVLDPDHAEARADLGYQKHDGRWMTEAEVRAARGLVHFRGAWVKQSEAEAVLQQEADRAARVALESEMVKAQKEVLAAEADYLRAKAEGERIRAQIEEHRREALWRPVYWWSACGPRVKHAASPHQPPRVSGFFQPPALSRPGYTKR
jgi:hypothetical protein